MNDAIRKKVLEILQHFHATERRIALLRYEMEHPAHLSPEDMIEAMALRHGLGSGTPTNQISDKTMYIAMHYQEEVESTNIEVLSEVSAQLFELESQQHRLLHYIGLLDEVDAAIIRMTYIDELVNEEIADKLGVSVRTVSNRRARAIDQLCEMYAFADEVCQGDSST